ncbi:MAG: glutamate-5-semialdehyde dehydrogenase [Bacteriovoracaceae bacterium]
MSIIDLAKKTKEASLHLQALTEPERVQALKKISEAILENKIIILDQNQIDLEAAHENKLSSALIDRLTLTEKSIQSLAQMCLDVANQPQVTGIIDREYTRPNGLQIKIQRIPIGVVAMIFESRPNVVVDGIALAIKSGNAIILKGGKEAAHSNRCLYEICRQATEKILPSESFSLVETREDVNDLLKLDQYIDLVVPRGGSALVKHVKDHARMPVVAHDKGLCHMYVHKDADIESTVKIILNAKTQRIGVCNALESLLLHESFKGIKEVIEGLIKAGVEIRGDKSSHELNPAVKLATADDYHTEYLDMILSLKIVKNEQEAIKHIQDHTSHHTESILAHDPKVIELFLNSLDSSCLAVNASTRFNDGGELGLGAELGISTSKLHAYGPMGAREMTTTRFLVYGNGHIR